MKFLLTLLFCTGAFLLIAQEIEGDERFNDLPPTAEYGKCYAKCKSPDEYETFTRKVLVEPAYTRTKVIPATYRTIERKVLVTPGGVDYKTIPATYKTVTEKEIIEPEQTIVNVIPAKYETRTRKVLVKEASGRWVKKLKDPNCFSEDPEDCLIACYEKIPAEYSTETYQVMISPERTEERIIPAKYRTVKRQVVDTPEKVIEIPFDPVYKTVTEKVVATPEKIEEIPVPAVYKTVEEKRLVKKGGYTVWTEILCANKTSSSTIRKVQRALRAFGYSVGVVDGVLGTRTQTALTQFQSDNGLPVGNFNIETLEALGVPH